MAGAGQPWYMPGLWPAGHVVASLVKPNEEKPPSPSTSPLMDFIDIGTAVIAGLRNFGLAYFCIYVLYDSDNPYPAFGDAKELKLDWMIPIIKRDLIATLLICGFWDWFLYFSPVKTKLHKYKINSIYPSFQQIKHDAAVTMFASFTGACVEIFLCHAWATGTIKYENDFFGNFYKNLILAGLVTFWRIPHFHILHRGMHPWRTTSIPDIGKWLYKKVHALHHKSYNPTAFSGTNMHPVESTLYYTAAFIPCLWGGHPILALTAIIDCAIGAWLGHDGFQWPGSGDYFHMLHHKHFDCNYGAQHIPLDWFFGTYAGGKEDIRKIWGKKPSGEEANDSPLHPKSISKFSVS